jgi:hypothetical protein
VETLSKSQAKELSNSVMKYIKKARYFRIRVDLPGISPELERESIINALKKGFSVLSVSKVNGKGSHKRIYVNLRVKN